MNKHFIYILLGVVILIVGFIALSKKGQEIDLNAKKNMDAFEASLSANDIPTVKDEVTVTSTTTSTTTIKTSPITKTEDNKKIMNATFHTNKGDFTIEFSPKETPNTVANFIKLASAGFYDGVKFHRVIKGFMIQGGDPLTKDDSMSARWGTGGPGYMFDDEVTPENRNAVGTISMANAGPDTNGSQFFINTKDNNFLDTKHTVFGKVTSGMDVVRAIESTPVGAADRPVEAVVIKNITLK